MQREAGMRWLLMTVTLVGCTTNALPVGSPGTVVGDPDLGPGGGGAGGSGGGSGSGSGGGGGSAGGAGDTRLFRHVSANLDDVHLGGEPGVLRHLEAKGPVTAMTKAASYLLWSRAFSEIRGYLLGHMVWMISDSTGIPPEQSGAAGFEQIPYGHFEGPFLKAAQRPSEAFQKLWASSVESISFRFGYPDVAGNSHLLITRRPAK